MAKSGTKVNFLYNMIYQVALMILPLITMPYISRVLGADGIGVYSYTYSIAQYFLLFGMLGVENYGNRSIAQVRDGKIERSHVFSSIYSLQFMIAGLSVLTYALYVCFICSSNKMYAFIQMFYVLTGMFDINWLFWGMEDFKLTVTKKILVKLVNVLCIFVFVRTKEDLWKYLLVLSLGYFISQSSMWLFAKKYVKFQLKGWKDAIPHFTGMLILFVPIIAVSIYRMMDKVMIGAFSTMEQVGFYENSEKLINVCLCVISAFGAVMMPRMSHMIANGKINECKELFEHSMEIAIFLGSAIAFGISSIASDFIPIFYGQGYNECIKITLLLSTTVIFITWACVVRTLYLIPAERNKIYICSVLLGAGINLFINILLIPHYAAIGAAIGTIVAEITVAVFQTIAVAGELKISRCIMKAIPFLIIGIIMYVVVATIPINVDGNMMMLLLKISAGAAVYLFLSAFYFILTKNKIFFDVIRKFKLKLIK